MNLGKAVLLGVVVFTLAACRAKMAEGEQPELMNAAHNASTQHAKHAAMQDVSSKIDKLILEAKDSQKKLMTFRPLLESQIHQENGRTVC